MPKLRAPALRGWLAMLMGAGLLVPAAGAQTHFWTERPHEQRLQALIERMSLSELVGQVMLYTYAGDDPDEDFIELVRTHGLGGIKIFGWNANNLQALTRAVRRLQDASQTQRLRIPLFVATDQEGGWVRHVRSSTSTTPGNLALGASGLYDDAYWTGWHIGKELWELGINMNFAPTVDLYTNLEAHVIGPRSFGDDPVRVALMAVAFYKGQEAAGVIATAKHFPGHGDTGDDSHGRLPTLNLDLETLRRRELIPYDYLIRENIPAIMTGHLAYPKLTGSNEPATLSPAIGTLIRETLGHRNLVVTDDLFMEGARATGLSYPRILEQALRAGNDLLMLSQPWSAQREALRHLTEVAARDPVFLARLKDAVAHNLRVKLRYLDRPDRVPLRPNPDTIYQRIPRPEASEFFLQQAARSVTTLRGRRLPLDRNARILVVTPYPRMFQRAQARFPRAELAEYSYDPFFGSVRAFREGLLARARSYDLVLFNLVTPGSIEYLKVLQPLGDRVAVLSLLTPVYLRETPWVQTAVAAYGTNLDSIDIGLAVLAGDFEAPGRLPLRGVPW